MSIVAANLGTAALTAHQIAMTLWMLMSLVCDGFADVGTIVGSKLLGEMKAKGHAQEFKVLRDLLMLFGCGTGLLAGVSMWFCRDLILDVFHVNNSTSGGGGSHVTSATTGTSALLVTLWPLICGMQLINAAVFVLDGFVYATHSFKFIRNLMLGACLLWFFPALVVGQSLMHNLLAVWIAKAGLNSARVVGAVWLMYFSLPMEWEKREKRVGREATMLSDPLLE